MRTPTILLLDDDSFHCHLLAEGLEEYYGFKVVSVANLVAAEEVLKRMHPDILLLDLILSNGDRLAVIRWVRSMRQDSALFNPILFMTAYHEEVKEYVRDLDGIAIIGKPFNFAEVTQRIQELLIGEIGGQSPREEN